MPLNNSRLLWLPFAVLIAAGLLLPAYGPLISKSYAEMLPEHSHVLLADTPEHSHDYEAPGSPATGDVLSLPGVASDGLIAVVVVATGALILASRSLLPAVVGIRRLVISRTLALLRGIALTPAAPPPKPALLLS
jgi:hypothetical protein